MRTCMKCGCPLLLLKVTAHQTETRRTCTRCFEAAQEKKVYRAPKVPKPAEPPAPAEEFSVEAFMNGQNRPKSPEVSRE